jgi:SAM-dependent methyltransferase
LSTKQQLENISYIPKEWETVLCPVCCSSDSRLWERYGNEWQYTYVLCNSCHMVYQNPRPKYDANFVYDAYEFYASDEETEFQADPVKYYEVNGSGYKNDLRDILIYDKKRTAFLDVGCYLGSLLYYAKPYYKQVFGVEISTIMAKLAERALNVRVFTDKFENLNTNVKFSCISLSHVIEHIPNPHQWLQKAKQILDDDGIIVISVPNMFSLTRLIKLFYKRIGIRKGKWESWRTPDHLFEPTIKGMARLFELNDLQVINFYTYSRSDHKFMSHLIHKKLYFGSNLRFIVKSNN